MLASDFIVKWIPTGETIVENKGYAKVFHCPKKSLITREEFHKRYGIDGGEVFEIGLIRDDVVVGKNGEWHYLSEVKVVKPYLCTHNIKEGDEIVNILDGKNKFITTTGVLKHESSIRTYGKMGCVKISGVTNFYVPVYGYVKIIQELKGIKI